MGMERPFQVERKAREEERDGLDLGSVSLPERGLDGKEALPGDSWTPAQDCG